jgi:hypothetical protein
MGVCQARGSVIDWVMRAGAGTHPDGGADRPAQRVVRTAAEKAARRRAGRRSGSILSGGRVLPGRRRALRRTTSVYQALTRPGSSVKWLPSSLPNPVPTQ